MNVLHAGLAAPAADAQACFRAVLDALARPGTLQIVGRTLTPPPSLGAAAAAVLLTLADADTPLWLDPAFDAARPWLAFHTGAPLVPMTVAASFLHARALPDLHTLNRGSDEAPEAAATVIVEVGSLDTGPSLLLTGPGLAQPGALRAHGLPADFPAIWAANRALFPRGVDLLLTCGTRLAALPRSVVVSG